MTGIDGITILTVLLVGAAIVYLLKKGFGHE